MFRLTKSWDVEQWPEWQVVGFIGLCCFMFVAVLTLANLFGAYLVGMGGWWRIPGIIIECACIFVYVYTLGRVLFAMWKRNRLWATLVIILMTAYLAYLLA